MSGTAVSCTRDHAIETKGEGGSEGGGVMDKR